MLQILCSVDPKLLKLTPHDEYIYKAFREEFPDLKVDKLDEDQLKSPEAKEVLFFKIQSDYFHFPEWSWNLFSHNIRVVQIKHIHGTATKYSQPRAIMWFCAWHTCIWPGAVTEEQLHGKVTVMFVMENYKWVLFKENFTMCNFKVY